MTAPTRAQIEALVRAAQDVIDRWHSPLWAGSAGNIRHTGEYIAALNAAVDAIDLAPAAAESHVPDVIFAWIPAEMRWPELAAPGAADQEAA